jgi:hypothetical protein
MRNQRIEHVWPEPCTPKLASGCFCFDPGSKISKASPPQKNGQALQGVLARCSGRAPGSACPGKNWSKVRFPSEINIARRITLHGTDPCVVKQVRGRILEVGFNLAATLDGEAKYLGVGQGGRRVRRTGVQRHRVRLALARGRRATALRFTRRAGKLATTGVVPQALCGSAAGMAPRRISQLRVACARTQKSGHVDACPTTLLAMPPTGSMADPAVKCRVQQIFPWLGLWRQLPPTKRPLVAASWQSAVVRLAPLRSRWRNVAGPLAPTVATLLDLGWTPHTPTHWTDDVHVDWHVDCVAMWSPLEHAVCESVRRQLWSTARRYHCGSRL